MQTKTFYRLVALVVVVIVAGGVAFFVADDEPTPKRRFEASTKTDEGLAAAEADDGRQGAINRRGEWVVMPAFKEIKIERPSSQCLVLVLDDDWWTFRGPSGNAPASKLFTNVSPFAASGLALAEDSDGYGLINARGHWLSKQRFSDVDAAAFVETGLTPACQEEKCGFLDQDGAWFVAPSPSFRLILPFAANGLAAAQIWDGRWGFINDRGELVIAPAFLNVRSFAPDGWARAQAETGQWGFIDASGEWVVAPKFWRLEDFRCH
ncbi:MAG: WG repeat-containing protein [Deltaproteobacteria bacterium]|jgi:hypothetical protein|nr:WG repeat-containing protein [Deltaproteobacteria bacterium]